MGKQALWGPQCGLTTLNHQLFAPGLGEPNLHLQWTHIGVLYWTCYHVKVQRRVIWNSPWPLVTCTQPGVTNHEFVSWKVCKLICHHLAGMRSVLPAAPALAAWSPAHPLMSAGVQDCVAPQRCAAGQGCRCWPAAPAVCLLIALLHVLPTWQPPCKTTGKHMLSRSSRGGLRCTEFALSSTAVGLELKAL